MHQITFVCYFFHLFLLDKVNKASLRSIHRSIVVLCLDGYNPATSDVRSIAGHQMLHGIGPNAHGGNRWFDKTIQVRNRDPSMCAVLYI